MNVDLEKALGIMQDHFHDAEITGNVVTVSRPELTWMDINHLTQVVTDCPKSRPWVFRSGKGVKVVVFIKVSEDEYLTSVYDVPNKYKKGHRVRVIIEGNQYTGEQDSTVVTDHGESVGVEVKLDQDPDAKHIIPYGNVHGFFEPRVKG